MRNVLHLQPRPLTRRQRYGRNDGEQENDGGDFKRVNVFGVEDRAERLCVAVSIGRWLKTADAGICPATHPNHVDQLDNHEPGDQQAEWRVPRQATTHPLDIDIEHHHDKQEQHHYSADINQHENDGEEFGKRIGRAGAHWATILAVGLSFVLSVLVLKDLYLDGGPTENYSVYTWAVSDGLKMELGFLIDRLTALMMVVVTFVSFMVHIYTIGYMHDDSGYQRFFSYISLFTFSMLMLVMSNNFLQLFFGWEAVGLVSYLLIGFWFKRETAILANLKAFLVNRVGDFGFILGIAGIVMFSDSLDYATVFASAPSIAAQKIEVISGVPWNAMTLICILLFIGAMGKSAQAPLHVWLPDSMEGPTPISALIHAATMVTAGIFMVARMSPLFELSETALAVVVVIGAITAFFMGLLGIVQNDIKRLIAYSTLSQLGYMTVALGVSAYSAAIFHLMTHAFFKALLFLAAGSVIIALHHEQNIRNV